MKSKFGDDLMPRRATKHSCGYDFRMPYEVTIGAGQTVVVDSGISLEQGDLGFDEVMLLFPRSSLGIRYGLRLKNSTGVIDSDYRDTIKIAITTDTTVTLAKGEKIMQGVVLQYGLIPNEIEPTETRHGGIGSTGRM